MQTYPTGYAESHRMVEQIFREILPRRGMAVREEQIALCHEVLDTLYNKEISLCEAGVGIGKTLAYLVACILWQMHRPNQLKMPVVISTSSVALQDAILNEYLPDLSAVLLAEGIITKPITAVVRKGKERFVCDARLAERQAKAISKGQRQKGSLRIININHTLIYRLQDDGRVEYHITTPKTEAGIREIPMMDEVYDALVQLKNWQVLVGDAHDEIDGYSGFILTNRFGNVCNPHTINRVIERMYKGYNKQETEQARAEGRQPMLIRHFSVHNLRHTFCTRFCENETNLKVIQDIMGHADITTTMNIYAEATKEKKQQAMANLNGKIKIM